MSAFILYYPAPLLLIWVIAPYLGIVIDWISMSDSSYGDTRVIGLINIWFPVERSPPPSFFCSLSFRLCHQSERMVRRHSEYQVADWGCHCGPWWTLVARCACPLVSAAGFLSWACEGLSGWTDGAEEIAERSAVPHWGPPLILSFSLFITASNLLMMVSDVFTYPMVPSPMLRVPPEINLPLPPHGFDWQYWMSYFVMIPQTLAKVATDGTAYPSWIHPSGALGSIIAHSSGIKGKPFIFAIDCICCRMLFKCGTVWETYITGYNTEWCEGWSLELFSSLLFCCNCFSSG